MRAAVTVEVAVVLLPLLKSGEPGEVAVPPGVERTRRFIEAALLIGSLGFGEQVELFQISIQLRDFVRFEVDRDGLCVYRLFAGLANFLGLRQEYPCRAVTERDRRHH